MIEIINDATLVTVPTTVLVILVVVFLVKSIPWMKSGKRLPPCLPALPIVGSLPFATGGSDVLPKKFMELAKKLGPVFSLYSGSRYAIVLNGKTIFDALVKNAEAFADRPVLYTEVELTNPDRRGMSFAPYDKTLKKYHKLFLSIMKEFGFGMVQESDNRIWKEAERLIEKIREYKGQPVDPKSVLLHSTTNVMINILFGEKFQEDEFQVKQVIEKASEWVDNIEPVIDILPMVRFVPSYRKKLFLSTKAQEELFRSIEVAIECNKKSGNSTYSFTSRFLEIEGLKYNHQDLIFMLRDFCGASSDTVLAALIWLLFEMANNPQIQSRIQQELDEVVPDHRLPSYEDRTNLPYTEATLLEVFRCHSPLPLALLHETTAETEIGGYSIPKGSMVIPNLVSVHMDPEIWTDPENFRPERFLNLDNEIMGRENVIAFGVGKRACIGEILARQEVFVFSTSLLRHFDIRPANGHRISDVKLKDTLVVSPVSFELRFIPRRESKA